MSDCDACTMKSFAACAACLGLDSGGPVLDAKGKEIEPGARVHVPPRPGLTGGAEVPGFSGFVISASPSQVNIQEIGSFNTRTVHPSIVRVKGTLTKAAAEHQAAVRALRGTLAKGKRK